MQVEDSNSSFDDDEACSSKSSKRSKRNCTSDENKVSCDNLNKTCEIEGTDADNKNKTEHTDNEIIDKTNICQIEENNDQTIIADKPLSDDGAALNCRVLMTRIANDDEEEAGPSVRNNLDIDNNSMDNNTTPISSSDEELENIFNKQKKARNSAANRNTDANRDTNEPNSEATAAASSSTNIDPHSPSSSNMSLTLSEDNYLYGDELSVEDESSEDDNEHEEEENPDDDSDDSYTMNDESCSSSSSSYASVPDGATRQKLNNNKRGEILTASNIVHKPKPRYAWTALPAVFYRQNGLSNKIDPRVFENKFYSSLCAVERLELMYKLEKHDGCVNALCFNKTGNLLVSGSDDLKIILWKWASNEIMLSLDSGHMSNIFQTKFLELDNVGIDIASCSRDGQIRHTKILPCGTTKSTIICKHSNAVNKLSVSPSSPHELLSVGEDGRIVRCDLRDCNVERLLTVRVNKSRLPLYSISSHPFEPEFCICGRDSYVRVYDKRNIKGPAKLYAPAEYVNERTHITCAVYNYLGTEILASCSSAAYLFDTKENNLGEYKHKYSGHRNIKTTKGISFFGPQSEYVISGSDCGNCFVWDKKTEAIVQWMAADEMGSVNCIEPHPSVPVLATSGLDYDIKIWVPSRDQPPQMERLKRCVESNLAKINYSKDSCNMFDEQMLNFYVRQFARSRTREDPYEETLSLGSDVTDSDERDNISQNPCSTS